jgi:GAF domain-containing protein
VYSGDLGADPRYPGFGPAAQAAGIRSALAYRLLVDGADGALNLYAQLPNAYGSDDRAKAAILAALAGTALSAAVNRRDAQARSDNLEQALLSREVIGQAQGILIERERITAEQAFDILRRASQHLNEKLRDIAQHLVDTGEDPDTGSRP